MQSKWQSFLEANANTFVGFGVSFVLTYTVLPLYGTEQSVVVSFEITLIYTAVSVARNYIVRRFFNRKGKSV